MTTPLRTTNRPEDMLLSPRTGLLQTRLQTVPRTGDLNDAILSAKVQAVVMSVPSLRTSAIQVDTRQGKVHLSGIVSSQANIAQAIRLVRNIEGVGSVSNGMRLH